MYKWWRSLYCTWSTWIPKTKNAYESAFLSPIKSYEFLIPSGLPYSYSVSPRRNDIILCIIINGSFSNLLRNLWSSIFLSVLCVKENDRSSTIGSDYMYSRQAWIQKLHYRPPLKQRNYYRFVTWIYKKKKPRNILLCI